MWKTCGWRSSGPQRADPSDAEDDLLTEPVLFVAAVETIGHRNDVGRVSGNVGVEQVERDPSDIDTPDLHQRGHPGEVDLDDHIGLDDAECVRVDRFVSLFLPSVGVEALAEIALGIEQTDADEGHAEIRRCLEVIAGQNPEAAGVLRERFGDPELRGEVGDAVQG